MRGPPVKLCSVSHTPNGWVSLSVAIGKDPERKYFASVDMDEPGFHATSLDTDLFFKLSELSARRYADCGRYHMELCRLLVSIARGETLELPVVLGATRFARRPSLRRWIRNHTLRWLSRFRR